MIRPKQGQNYTTQPGDTFPIIAGRAGFIESDWPLIRDANQLQFKTDDQESVQPGEVLFIPIDPVIAALR